MLQRFSKIERVHEIPLEPVAGFYMSNNNSNQGMMLLRMLPTLLINAVAPFLINTLVRPYMSPVNALLLASSVPALFTLGGLIWKKRIDAVGGSLL
jgi:hypothetical protein